MASFISRCMAVAAFALPVLLLTPVLRAAAQAVRPQAGSPEAILLDATNHDRAAAGLPAYQWDESLAAAARKHAELMAQRRTLSHQFPAENSLQDRATQSGARFGVIAENVAEGPTVPGLQTQWMNSPPHRANILADDMNAIGIAVVQNGNSFFAVEDFSEAVPMIDLGAQESQVEQLLASRGLKVVKKTSDARKTCESRAFAGAKPAAVLAYETTDLSHLPADIDQKVRSGKYQSAAVGACAAGSSDGFTQFRIAILLFP